MMDFLCYRRPDGGVGTRNHVLVIPSVGCSLCCARDIVNGLRGAVYIPNILGCGQLGEDRAIVKRTLVGFGTHPNVFGVLVVGNGCEHLAAYEIVREIQAIDRRAEGIVIQEEGGTRKTIAAGRKIVKEMLREAGKCSRVKAPISDLVLGTECGGSDFTSGLSSNPAVGRVSDTLVAEGGTVILSETPELIGAQHILARRARTVEIGNRVLDAVSWWESRALAAGENIRNENPSPGNITGGITTLEEKSLGCIHKAGGSPLEEFITYASRPTKKGLVFMDTPANDIEQLTGMVAGGAQIVAFTTGRGSAIGSPIVPVVKITGNRNTYARMRDNMDVNVSKILDGKETVKEAGSRVLEEIVATASGKLTKAERLRQSDFAIFKMNP